MNKRWMMATAITGLLLLGGCATNQRSNSLRDTLTAYAAAVRWGSFEQASNFLDPDYRKSHPLTQLDMKRYHQIQVSEYDSGNGAIPVDDNTVQQIVRIDLININTQHQRTIIDHQIWTYDPAKKHWWLHSGLPDITPGH